jgi:hypothetical protein
MNEAPCKTIIKQRIKKETYRHAQAYSKIVVSFSTLKVINIALTIMRTQEGKNKTFFSIGIFLFSGNKKGLGND